MVLDEYFASLKVSWNLFFDKFLSKIVTKGVMNKSRRKMCKFVAIFLLIQLAKKSSKLINYEHVKCLVRGGWEKFSFLFLFVWRWDRPRMTNMQAITQQLNAKWQYFKYKYSIYIRCDKSAVVWVTQKYHFL